MNFTKLKKENNEELKEKYVDVKSIDLDNKVDEYINWYKEKFLNEFFSKCYSESTVYKLTKEMRNFIEKMAVWYELRYPDYEMNQIIESGAIELDYISDVMFNTNPYIRDLLGINSDIKDLDWCDFYNKDTFIASSADDIYFSNIFIDSIVYLNKTLSFPHIYFNGVGKVREAEGITEYTKGLIKDKDLVGFYIKDVVELFKLYNIEYNSNDIDELIVKLEKDQYRKKEMLNCVMYRIIERGGTKIGSRRAYLFAKDFGLNLDIPMKYGVEEDRFKLRRFINEYLKDGGSKDLECYVSYPECKAYNKKVKTITIQELLLTSRYEFTSFYTPEEDELHQRFVDAIASQVDQDVVNQEEAKQLRLKK